MNPRNPQRFSGFQDRRIQPLCHLSTLDLCGFSPRRPFERKPRFEKCLAPAEPRRPTGLIDVFSRRVVGWAMATHLRTELVLDALETAIHQRKPQSMIHHSGQGCQYRRSLLADAVKKRGFGLRWDRWPTVMTTRCARALTRPWSASCSIGIASETPERHNWRSSTSSRAGTIHIAGTRRWITRVKYAIFRVSRDRGQVQTPFIGE